MLLVIFITSFLLYKKTPPPKGCEDISPNEGKCHGCKEVGCHFNLYYNSKEENKDEDMKNENDVN